MVSPSAMLTTRPRSSAHMAIVAKRSHTRVDMMGCCMTG